MKKKITFILVVLIIMSNMMTTFAYSYKDIGDFSNNNVLRDNRYYYTVDYEFRQRGGFRISEEEARNEQAYEEAIRKGVETAVGFYAGTDAGDIAGWMMQYYHSPYDSAGWYEIKAYTCRRIRHDRLTGETRQVSVGDRYVIIHNGQTYDRDFWY